MGATLAIKSSRRYMMPNILLSFICCICSILAAYQSFLLSYLMTIIVSRHCLIFGFMFFFGYFRKRSKKVKRTTISDPPKNHQVFINFRGDQLRHNFISHLSNAFKNEGIKFFVDNDMIAGKDLKNLFVKIEESRIALAIFSTRYPESKWCMNELVKMKKRSDEGKLHIIPIFYKVDASHVKKPTRESEFGKNFWRLMEAYDQKDPIQEWREALECISNKLGLNLGDKSSEADFVKVIVKAVERVNEAIGVEEEENHGGKIKEKFRALQFPTSMKNILISNNTSY